MFSYFNSNRNQRQLNSQTNNQSSQPSNQSSQPNNQGSQSKIEKKVEEIMNYIKKDEVKQQLAETTLLFLQLVEATATLIPLFGPVIVLGAQVVELQFIKEELKKKILDFINQIEEYAKQVDEVVGDLLKMIKNNIDAINQYDPNNSNQIEIVERLIKHTDKVNELKDKINTNIQNSKDYLAKIILNKSRFSMRSMLTSTTTISARIDSFRISIIDNLVILLFQIDAIFIDSINAITTQQLKIGMGITTLKDTQDTQKATLNNLTVHLSELEVSLKENTENLEKLESNLSNLTRKSETIIDNTIFGQDTGSDTGWGVGPAGGYKFKSKKNKRKLNKFKKIKRKSKRNKKSKKYI